MTTYDSRLRRLEQGQQRFHFNEDQVKQMRAAV